MTHFCRRFPMKSCKPTRAKTARQNTVRIITSRSFFTDWISAPTMVFRPGTKISKVVSKVFCIRFLKGVWKIKRNKRLL